MRRRLIPILIFGAVGVSILVALGTWQVRRLAWKEALIAGLETRLSADPAPLPASPDPTRDAYLRVTAEGRFEEGDLLVLTSTRPWGPGFRVIAPFRVSDGRRVLVDRGFVPDEMKDDARPLGEGRVTGALVWPNETDGFTPAPDLAAGIWFARDVAAMAVALDAAPVMIAAESAPRAGEWPAPRPVTVNIPNDHLQYAITWFSLAAIWVAMTAAAVLRVRRRGRL